MIAMKQCCPMTFSFPCPRQDLNLEPLHLGISAPDPWIPDTDGGHRVLCQLSYEDFVQMVGLEPTTSLTGDLGDQRRSWSSLLSGALPLSYIRSPGS